MWNNRSLIKKLFAYTVLVSFLPLCLLGVTSYVLSSTALTRQANHFAQTVLSKTEEILLIQIEQVESLTSQIAGIESITSSLEATDQASISTYDMLANKARIGYTLNRFLSVRGLASIDLIGAQGIHYHVGDTLQAPDTDQTWKKRLLEIAEKIQQPVYWLGVERNVNPSAATPYVLPVIRALRKIDRDSREFILTGAVIANFSVDHVYDILSSVDMGEGGFLMVIDESGRLIYHPDKSLIGEEYQLPFSPSHKATSLAPKTVAIDGESLVLNQKLMRNTGWHILSLVPEKTIEEDISIIGAVTVVVVIVCLTLVAFAGMGVSRAVVKPIQQVIASFKRYQKGDLDLNEKLSHPGNDEIAQLIQWFNTFMDTLKLRVLYEQELEKAKLAAETASRAKSSFLANMSHEIRTPLNGVLGVAQILEKTSLDEKQRQHLKTLRASGGTLLSIINDILDISKIEAGKIQLESIPFSLHKLMEDVIELYTPICQQKELLLSLDYAADCPEVFVGDPVRIKQCIMNLISNATKFTSEGFVKASAKATDVNGSLYQVVICIEDSGIGISREDQSRLFRSFVQADSSTTRKYGGTGLGLSITSQLIALMNGKICVDSKEGAGTRFYIELPLQTSSAPLTVEETSHHNDMTFSGKVLLVEDVLVNQIVAASLLEDLGMEVDIAEDGVIALEKIKSKPFDLVLMDCHMPNMDGFEASRRIRADISQDIPIIALTADAFNENKTLCITAGMNDFLAKPYGEEELAAILKKWLP